MRAGIRLGVDVGSVRVGVAISDPRGELAVPLEVVARDRRGESDVTRLATLVAEREAVEVVVGLPRTLAGRRGPAEEGVRAYARVVARRLAPVPVRLVDERLSTVTASRTLRAAGVGGRRARAVVDAAAAAVVLQAALDAERGSGALPGELVSPSE